jgi:hypothetical protein
VLCLSKEDNDSDYDAQCPYYKKNFAKDKIGEK